MRKKTMGVEDEIKRTEIKDRGVKKEEE